MELYKRNQIHDCLWRVFRRSETRSVPKAFHTRIKRLLEVDRAKHPLAADGSPVYAFIDDEPEGKGTEIGFTEFNVFCLALGLDLLDAGYVQTEVTFLLQQIRGVLQHEFDQILANPPDPNGWLPPHQRPNCPKAQFDGTEIADCRVYMAVEKVEIKEVLVNAPKGPQFAHPMFFRGINELTRFFNARLWWQRKVMIVEIAQLASKVVHELAQTEPALRGRPRR